jgi:hypothetical protein
MSIDIDGIHVININDANAIGIAVININDANAIGIGIAVDINVIAIPVDLNAIPIIVVAIVDNIDQMRPRRRPRRRCDRSRSSLIPIRRGHHLCFTKECRFGMLRSDLRIDFRWWHSLVTVGICQVVTDIHTTVIK